MNIYFVHSRNYENLLRQEEVKIIVSYARRHAKESGFPEVPKGFPEVMIDSGGFQLQKGTGDREVFLKAYALWLHLLLPRYPEVKYYMNLDIWRDGEASLSNLRYLESQELSPMPIWHSGTEVKYLDYYYNNYEYIAIGGIANIRNKPALQRIVNWLFQSYPNRKYHFLGIGLTGMQAFSVFKPHSIDFSTWGVAARYGHQIIIRDGVPVEVVLPPELKQKLRDDKEYLEQTLIESVRQLKKLETYLKNGQSQQGVLL